MNIINLAKQATRSLLATITRALGEGPKGPAWKQPPHGQNAAPAITGYTISGGKSAIEAHEAGQFTVSALIADHIGRDADVQQALNQRILALQGMPFELEDGNESEQAAAVAKQIRPLWERMVPRRVLSDLLRWGVLLGFAIAQIRWQFDEQLQHHVPVLEPWHPSNCWHDQTIGVWKVVTTRGVVDITPNDGRWVIYQPFSAYRSYMYGAVRCLPEWFLAAQYARRDANRFSEVHGMGVWVPMLPANWQSTVEGRAFVDSFLNIGSEPVIPAPRGATPESSYDLKLIEAQSNAWQVFEFLLKLSAQKIRLCILGQDMTSSEGTSGSYAKSRVGYNVLMSIVASDAETLGEDLREQLLKPFAWYLTGNKDTAPKASWDYDPPEDAKAVAEALNAAADALSKWDSSLQGSSEVVDKVAMARRFGVLLMPAPAQQLPAPTPPEPTQ